MCDGVVGVVGIDGCFDGHGPHVACESEGGVRPAPASVCQSYPFGGACAALVSRAWEVKLEALCCAPERGVRHLGLENPVGVAVVGEAGEGDGWWGRGECPCCGYGWTSLVGDAA